MLTVLVIEYNLIEFNKGSFVVIDLYVVIGFVQSFHDLLLLHSREVILLYNQQVNTLSPEYKFKCGFSLGIQVDRQDKQQRFNLLERRPCEV